MSRRTALTALTALTAVLLAGGAGAPALAEEPVRTGGDRLTFCVIAGPQGGDEGLCVWVPDPR